MKGSLDYERNINLKLDDEFVKVSREMNLSNALSHKSVHNNMKPSLSQDSCILKQLLETEVSRVLNYNSELNLRIERSTIEREDIVK